MRYSAYRSGYRKSSSCASSQTACWRGRCSPPRSCNAPYRFGLHTRPGTTPYRYHHRCRGDRFAFELSLWRSSGRFPRAVSCGASSSVDGTPCDGAETMTYTVAEAAKAIGKSKATVFRAIAKGTISATRDDTTGAFLIDPADKRPELVDHDVSWNIAIKRSIIKALPKALRELAEPVERALSQLRAVVEHPFHIVKNRFCHKKLRYRGLHKNTAQLHTLFALANLVIAKKVLLPSSAA